MEDHNIIAFPKGHHLHPAGGVLVKTKTEEGEEIVTEYSLEQWHELQLQQSQQ